MIRLRRALWFIACFGGTILAWILFGLPGSPNLRGMFLGILIAGYVVSLPCWLLVMNRLANEGKPRLGSFTYFLVPCLTVYLSTLAAYVPASTYDYIARGPYRLDLVRWVEAASVMPFLALHGPHICALAVLILCAAQIVIVVRVRRD